MFLRRGTNCRDCKKHKLRLPADLRECCEEWTEEDTRAEMPTMSRVELQGECDYVLQCLDIVREKMNLAYRLSISDVGSNKCSLSIAKHACLLEAEPFITEAKLVLESIGAQVQQKTKIQDITANMGKRIVISDIIGDGFFLEYLV